MPLYFSSLKQNRVWSQVSGLHLISSYYVSNLVRTSWNAKILASLKFQADNLIFQFTAKANRKINLGEVPDKKFFVYENRARLMANLFPNFLNFSNIGGCTSSPLPHTPMVDKSSVNFQAL